MQLEVLRDWDLFLSRLLFLGVWKWARVSDYRSQKTADVLKNDPSRLNEVWENDQFSVDLGLNRSYFLSKC